MNNETINNYNETRAKFLNGYITEDAWKEFCTEVLASIMDDTKDVFERLKFM